MKPNSLEDVFMEQIRELYDVEKQLVRALPKMVKAADSEELAEGLRAHLVETEEHVRRLDQVFEACDQKAKAKPCKAIRGLIEDAKPELREKGPLQDLAIIESGQKAEHYEIAGYGNARTLAERLGKSEVVALLDRTLQEEKAANRKLTEATPAILDREEESRSGEETEEVEETEEELENV
jgi:ferritin-like metal-binding protein YciE